MDLIVRGEMPDQVWHDGEIPGQAGNDASVWHDGGNSRPKGGPKGGGVPGANRHASVFGGVVQCVRPALKPIP